MGFVSPGKSSSDQRNATPEMSTPARAAHVTASGAKASRDVMVARTPWQRKPPAPPNLGSGGGGLGGALAESTLAEGFQRFWVNSRGGRLLDRGGGGVSVLSY